MISNNPIPIKKRLQALLWDYLLIWAYLLILLAVNLTYIFLFLKRMPIYTENQLQTIATFTSVLPITLFFAYQDYCHGGSWGKRRAGLQVVYRRSSHLISALLRNVLKFLPWQLGHVSTIRMMYQEPDLLAIALNVLSLTLLIIITLMALLRKDKRHLGDFLAGTQVQMKA